MCNSRYLLRSTDKRQLVYEGVGGVALTPIVWTKFIRAKIQQYRNIYPQGLLMMLDDFLHEGSFRVVPLISATTAAHLSGDCLYPVNQEWK